MKNSIFKRIANRRSRHERKNAYAKRVRKALKAGF